MWATIAILVLLGLWLLWMFLTWGVLVIEQRRPAKLSVMGADNPLREHPFGAKTRELAIEAGFVEVGAFVLGDSGLRQEAMMLMVSDDAITLLQILHSKIITSMVFTSVCTSDVWLITATAILDPDSTGLSEEEEVHSNQDFATVWSRHQHRIAGREHELIPWDPRKVVQDLEERERRKFQVLLREGQARVRNASMGTWSLTWKGAARKRLLMKTHIRSRLGRS